MTRSLRFLLVLVFSVPLVWLTPAPAHACDCVAPAGAAAAADAEAVFVATLDAPLAAGDPPDADQLSVTATVERVLKGDVAETVTITTSSSSCGVFGLDAGSRWLFVEDPADDGSVGISSCGDSGPASQRAVTQAERALGLPESPPSAAPEPGAPTDTVIDDPAATADDEAGSSTLPWLLGLAGLVVAVGAGVAWRSRGRSA